ncbi:MAG: ATP-binding protein [Roseobacter sp.]
MNDAEPAKTHREKPGQTSARRQGRWAAKQVGVVKSTAPLIAIRVSNFEIIAHSEDISDLLGNDTEHLLGLNFMQTHEHIALEILGLSVLSHITHEILDFAPVLDGVKYDAVTHLHEGVRIIEFLPTSNAPQRSMLRKKRLSSNACITILQAPDFDDALQTAAEATRDITEYARIKIHRFHPDWANSMVAESCDGTILSNLGHHGTHPATLHQLHQLLSAMEDSTANLATDLNKNTLFTPPLGEKVNLSFSVGNSISEMHAICLHKLGIKAALSCSLMERGKLWGTITAHDTTVGTLPFQDWCLLQDIASALMARHSQQQHIKDAIKTDQLRDLERKFASAFNDTRTVENTLQEMGPVLQKYLGADGFALQYGCKFYLSGSTPPRPFVQSLIDWSIAQGQSPQPFQTTRLHNVFPPAKEHVGTACGVTLWPTSGQSTSQFIWFRGPEPKGIEHPSLSDMQSASWHLLRDSRAKEDFANFLNVMASQVALKEENAALRQFSETASHDLKAPLRGITLALDIMQEEEFDEKHVREMHAVAATSARRLTKLTTGLLDLAAIGQKNFEFKPIALGSIFEDAQEMLNLQLTEVGATVTFGALPTVLGNELLLLRLALNLFENAIKFRSSERLLNINISTIHESDQIVEIAIADTGIGIAPEYAKRVFEPMQRLHTQDEIDGSGLGLAICEKIMKIHQGCLSIDTDYTDGAKFILRLNKSLDIKRPCQRQLIDKVHSKR